MGNGGSAPPHLRHLHKLTKKQPKADRKIRVEPSRLWARLAGKQLTVCPFRFLPRCEETVLLDIDVDFMVIPRVSYGRHDEHDRTPWCWPAELVDRLRAADVKTDLVTIARSVEGGYTPLKWKYLGDELAQRLADPAGRGPAIRGMDLMREAAAAAARGDLRAAETRYRTAAAALPDAAAPCYYLAHLSMDAGRLDDARELHRRALAMDPSYSTPFGSMGFPLYWNGRYEEAGHEFRRALLFDPRAPHAHLGLGLLALEAHRWDEAAMRLTSALSIDDRLVEGHRALGKVLARNGRRDEAIGAYERSLQLTLAGERSVARPIVTEPEDGRVVDPDHCRAHADLARLYAVRGSSARAIVGYQMSIAGGHDGAPLRRRLAWLYLKQGEWLPAGAQLWQCVKRSPRDCGRAARRGSERLRWFVHEKWRPLSVNWRAV